MIFKHTSRHADDSFNGKRIGVIGLGPRSGTTHIAISICNYLSEYRHRRVSLLEQNSHGDILKLTNNLGLNNSEIINTFHRVTYIPSFCDSFPLFDLKTDCMVFDLGYNLAKSFSTLKLCDIKIAVGTDAPWRREEYSALKALTGNNRNLSSWRLFVNLGNPRLLKEYDDYHMITGCFPFEPDPVYPAKETIKFLEVIIG